MKEVALNFGPRDGLVGVLSVPEAFGPSRVGVLFWNAGLLHRVGAARLYVTLGRELATQGFAVLRFDLAGRGDSVAPEGAEDDRSRAVGEVGAAMDVLASRAGVTRFILVGLCTGADQAHAAAVQDARVVGVVGVDGFAYPTAGFWIRRATAILLNPRRLASVVKRRLATRAVNVTNGNDGAKGGEAPVDANVDVPFPPRQAVQAELEALAARGTRVLCMYSGESAAVYNYREQFRDMFPGAAFDGRVEGIFEPGADHLFSLPGNGARFVSLIGGWVRQHFSGAT